MKLLQNSGTNRAIDRLREWLTKGSRVDLVSPSFSLFAFAEFKDELDRVEACRLLLGQLDAITPALFGSEADITFRSRLQGRWLAREASEWLRQRTEVRHARQSPPQSLILVGGKVKPSR